MLIHVKMHRIIKDVCGLFCACFTYALIFYGQYVVTFKILVPWLGFSPIGIGNLLFFNYLCIMAIVCQVRTMISDPGYVPIPVKNQHVPAPVAASVIPPNKSEGRHCKPCTNTKPIEAHHCSICNRCVVRMDHHCPWINNCVGQQNQKYFILFLFQISLLSVYSLTTILVWLFRCYADSMSCYYVKRDETTAIFVLFAFMESVVFGLFTTVMIVDQLSGIYNNVTYIQKLKGTSGTRGTKRSSFGKSMTSVFGGQGFSYVWFLPLAPKGLKDSHIV